MRRVSTTRVDGKPETSRGQDAIRILLIITAAAEPLPPEPAGGPAPADAVAVLHSQVRLQKLDFWVRNPEYFANELLAEYEQTGDVTFLDQATAILESDEPQVRRYPMLRYLFGAYEPLDDALAVLRSAGLVVRRKRGTEARVHRHDYYLTRPGRAAADRIVREAPVFGYYVRRTRLVARFAEGQGGTRLKERQYEQDEYRNTVIGDRIGSIAERVRERLRRLAVPVGVSTP
ncbi:hypothetical protein Ahu01nite_069540 [Winogradskya humida]|uniref:Uncharacterized protein n=1 Tax=Winogradskya humida TaxID=113566 RepID=A0ABQ3ZZ33_9ACTN|nr:hypothetical protein Ahu01nite_069540 [Actinoplanes humidus]